jgi:oxalate decarboxylase/phosphoglucose isomerase-like protein (cupin superfamily)
MTSTPEVSVSADHQAVASPAFGRIAEVYRAARQDKPWGYEQIFAAQDGKYVGKLIHVSAGQSLSLQYHQRKEETICLVTGEAIILFGPQGGEVTEQKFVPGDTIHIPPGTVHRVRAITDIVFAEVSTAPDGWREDVVRLEDAYGRTGTTAP